MMKKPFSKFLLFLSVLLFAALSVSCSKGKIELSEDGLKAREMNQMLDKIRESYLEKNPEKVAAHFSPEGAIPPEIVRETLGRAYEKNEPVSLGFYIEKVVLEEHSSEVFVHWEGEWRNKDHERVHLKRGNAVLSIRGTPEPLVWDIRGDSFLISGERSVED